MIACSSGQSFSSASARSLSVTPIGFPAASNTVSRSGTSCQSARLSSSLLLRSQNSTSRLRLLLRSLKTSVRAFTRVFRQ